MADKKPVKVLKVRENSIKMEPFGDTKRLHSFTSPVTTLYNVATDENELDIYAIHGIILNSDVEKDDRTWLVTKTKPLTVEDIESEANIEIRRLMLELYGIGNFLRDSEFEVLDTDTVTITAHDGSKITHVRTLVRKKMSNGEEDLVGVFVKNSSPNGTFSRVQESFKPLKEFSDFEQARIKKKYENTEYLLEVGVNEFTHGNLAAGEFVVKTIHEAGEFTAETDDLGNLVYKDYFLQVHPECRPLLDVETRSYGEPQELTCQNAVASTFGLTGKEYVPDIET